MKILQRTLTALSLPLLFAGPIQATTVMKLTAADLADRAELVFVGTALSYEAALTDDGLMPFTLVTFEIEQVVKGRTNDQQITLQLMGGPIGEDVIQVAGMPEFEPGTKYLLFVAGNTRRGCPVLGWGQGSLTFVRHPRSGESILVDEMGYPLLGIENGDWKRSTEQIDADGFLISDRRDDGTFVVYEDGVLISDDLRTKATADANAVAHVPAATVVDAVASLVELRRVERSFIEPNVVVSASRSTLPTIGSFDAEAPPN